MIKETSHQPNQLSNTKSTSRFIGRSSSLPGYLLQPPKRSGSLPGYLLKPPGYVSEPPIPIPKPPGYLPKPPIPIPEPPGYLPEPPGYVSEPPDYAQEPVHKSNQELNTIFKQAVKQILKEAIDSGLDTDQTEVPISSTNIGETTTTEEKEKCNGFN